MYLVATKGLAYVVECKNDQEVLRAIKDLQSKGYKKPLVFVNCTKIDYCKSWEHPAHSS